MLKEKRLEFDNKLEKATNIEKFDEWKISLLNEETIIRIIISEIVFEEEIETISEEFLRWLCQFFIFSKIVILRLFPVEKSQYMNNR